MSPSPIYCGLARSSFAQGTSLQLRPSTLITSKKCQNALTKSIPDAAVGSDACAQIIEKFLVVFDTLEVSELALRSANGDQCTIKLTSS
jgi:hypothetical protein